MEFDAGATMIAWLEPIYRPRASELRVLFSSEKSGHVLHLLYAAALPGSAHLLVVRAAGDAPCVFGAFFPEGALTGRFTGWTGDGRTQVFRLAPDPAAFRVAAADCAQVVACRSDALCVGPEPALMLDADLRYGQSRASALFGSASLVPDQVRHGLSDSNAKYFDVGCVLLLAL
jgi:hypothetical protein